MDDENPTQIGRLIRRRLDRRTMLKGLGALAATAALPLEKAHAARSTLTFDALPLTFDEQHHVAPGYRAERLVSWGDPVLAGAAPYDYRNQSAARQATQFGYNNDFTAYLPLDGSRRGLLCVNHEYTDPQLMFPGLDRKNAAERVTQAQAAIEMAAHGHTIVEIAREGAGWRVRPEGKFNRRITASTPCRVTGPAAGHRRMTTPEDPTGRDVRGTLANCSGGLTPWGTVLTAEENIDFYFSGTPATEQRNHERYSIGNITLYAWYKWEKRFRLDVAPNEPNRHGWLVEIDPRDPTAAPKKRTALGRFAHESGTVTLAADGRVVVYSGDDKRFEYLYRYVSTHPYDPSKKNDTLLDDGTLYAAKFHDDGTLEWLPLVHGREPLTAKNGFEDQGDVLIETRRAADLVGATQMDRPEDVGVEAKLGRVYVALTNNHLREKTNNANPRANNAHGHILELMVPRKDGAFDHAAPTFGWNVFLLGQDPRSAARRPQYIAASAPPSSALGLLALGASRPERDGVEDLLKQGERKLGKKRDEVDAHFTDDGVLSCPDNFAFDPSGRLWITTDGQDKGGVADSLYATDVTGPGRARARRFFNAPRGAEVSGPSFTPDGRTLFLCVQHPAQERDSTFDAPSTRWPDFERGAPPRPSVLAITKDDGGPVGG